MKRSISIINPKEIKLTTNKVNVTKLFFILRVKAQKDCCPKEYKRPLYSTQILTVTKRILPVIVCVRVSA